MQLSQDIPEVLCPSPGLAVRSLLSHSEVTLSLSHSRALPSFPRVLSAPDPKFGGFGGFGVVPLGRGAERGMFPKLPARSAPGGFGFSGFFLGMVLFSAASSGSSGFPGESCPKENRNLKKNTERERKYEKYLFKNPRKSKRKHERNRKKI